MGDQTIQPGKQHFLFLKSILPMELDVMNLGSAALFSGLEG